MVLLGVAGAADSVAPGAVMGDVVAGRGGTVVAVFQMAGDLGLVLGPIVTGWVADAAGYSPAFILCAVVCALPVLVVLAAPETLQPDRSVSALAAEDAARDAT
jgi:MFS family permease